MNKKDSAFLAAVSALAGYFAGQASSPDQKTASPPVRPSLVRDKGGPGDHSPSVRRAGVGRDTSMADRTSRVSPELPWEPRGMFAAAGVTREDWEKTIQLNQLQQRGEYVLKHERPTTRKIIDQDLTRIVTDQQRTLDGDYDRVFAQMAVTTEARDRIKNHVAKIHRASLEVEVGLDQLLQSRLDFEKRLQSDLSEQDYAAYRAFEDAKPAIREVEAIKSMASLQGVEISPDQEAAIKQLIQQERAYTTKSWHGPFDEIPQPRLGVEAVIAHSIENRDRIVERGTRLLDQAVKAGLPVSQQELLSSYYSQKATEYQAVVDKYGSQVRADASAAKSP